jgi:low affinity Fe/Cu permease
MTGPTLGLSQGGTRRGPGLWSAGGCQARHQRATQRKLDEILPATPGTDNCLLTLEHAADAELHATGHQHGKIRQAALDDRGSSDTERPEG